MSARLRNFRLPGPIDEAVELRVQQLGYRSASAYFLGLIRYDLTAMSAHELTAGWANQTDAEQSALNARLLENARKGEGQKGVLLHHIVEKVVEEKLGKKKAKKSTAPSSAPLPTP